MEEAKAITFRYKLMNELRLLEKSQFFYTINKMRTAHVVPIGRMIRREGRRYGKDA